MAKCVVSIIVLLATFHLMQATPIDSIVQPVASQATANVRTPTSVITSLIGSTINAGRSAIHATIGQIGAALRSIASITTVGRQNIREEIADRVAEVQVVLDEINAILQRTTDETIPAIRREVHESAAGAIEIANDLLADIRATIGTIRNNPSAIVTGLIQIVVEAKVNAVRDYISGVRDLLRDRVTAIEFERIKARVADALLQAAVRIVDANAPVAIEQVEAAIDLVGQARRIVATVAAVTGNEKAESIAANLEEAKVHLERLLDALEHIKANPEEAIRNNVVVQEIVNQINQLLQEAIKAIRRLE